MEILRHDGKKIRHAEKKLLVFHCIDVVERYDCINPPMPDELTQEDIRLANVMGARSPKVVWQGLIGKSLADIPNGYDLITMPEQEWKLCQPKMKDVLQRFLDNSGIACPVLTKALHRKRPAFLPVCDNVVMGDILPRFNPKNAETILAIMEIFRQVGIKNLASLQQIRNFLVQRNRLLDLTSLRMLEALYWMENIPRYKKLWSFMEQLKWWH